MVVADILHFGHEDKRRQLASQQSSSTENAMQTSVCIAQIALDIFISEAAIRMAGGRIRHARKTVMPPDHILI